MFDPTKHRRLQERLSALGSVAVAFSGGADSALLLAYSIKVLGTERVLAITADSHTLPRSELIDAQELANELGARHLVVVTDELHDVRFVANPPDRCYYCKQELFATMRQVADKEGYRHLVYGATADDLGDYRPGMRAAKEAKAVAPLLEAGLNKQDVRDLSRELGLRTWDKPAMACLSSRFPYGTPLTKEGLTRVEKAEDFLRRELGFRQVRVRDQGEAGDQIARIEVESEHLLRLVQEPLRSRVIGADYSARLKAVGYTYVTLNLEGGDRVGPNAIARSGSLNDVLSTQDRMSLQEPVEEV